MAPNLREPTWIAERPVVFVQPHGRRSDGRIAVGLPYMVSDVQARCPLILEGLETFPPQIAGGSTLQAMLLAVRLAFVRLQDFRARGGRIEYPAGEGGGEVDLEALFGMPRLAEQTGIDTELETQRENVVYSALTREDVPAALAEVESWSSWPIDEIGSWLVIETFFQSRRRECVPILERMLLSRAQRDELSVVRMKHMIGIAKAWG